ncbi:MAG: branched-chain amino acid ABC transporter permease [Chloroflexi bacterium]|nr:branched-chain amino acid ABC transporter permease [Chloroflexota bacterium]MCI0727777.1 branched-chain amino acid ABC transporter permease [Chloroflexota bacterium]
MLQVLVNGLLLGSNYALLALGYTLVFGVMRLLTLAHGEVFMAAGLLALLLAGSTTPVWLAGLYALAIGVSLGLATELLSFHPVGYQRPIAAAVSTIGLGIVIQDSILQIRGSATAVAISFPVPQTDFQLGPLLISSVQVTIFFIAVAVMIGTHLFVERSRWGMAMRALAHDPGMVALLGVPVRSLAVLALMLAGALAGLASYLLALRNGSVSPLAGLELGLKGLAIMTIGGLGSLPGAMIAGIGLGLVETLASYYGLGGFQAAVPWLLLVLVLLVRPEGIFHGRRHA